MVITMAIISTIMHQMTMITTMEEPMSHMMMTKKIVATMMNNMTILFLATTAVHPNMAPMHLRLQACHFRTLLHSCRTELGHSPHHNIDQSPLPLRACHHHTLLHSCCIKLDRSVDKIVVVLKNLCRARSWPSWETNLLVCQWARHFSSVHRPKT